MSASLQPSSAESAWEATVTRDVLVGRKVGDYVVRRRIGQGGMGIVYEAVHPDIGRRVAIKILRPDCAGDVYGLLREAQTAASVRHRGIIDVFGFGELQGIGHYIVMDFLEGRSLAEEISEEAPMAPEQVLSILDDALAALAAAHARNVVHRDLKPSNLFLVSESGGTRYVKVLDFGLAKVRKPGDGPVTRSGFVVGTPEYIAPEQALEKPVDGRADLYSLGVIAFEMLTGQLPFSGENALELMNAHVHAPPPRPSALAPVPEALDRLVLKLLSKRPEDRPLSAEAARAELKEAQRALSYERTQAQKPEPVPAPRVEVAERPPPSDDVPATATEVVSRHDWRRRAALGLGLAAAAAAVGWLLSGDERQTEEDVAAAVPLAPAEPLPSLKSDGTAARAPIADVASPPAPAPSPTAVAPVPPRPVAVAPPSRPEPHREPAPAIERRIERRAASKPNRASRHEARAAPPAKVASPGELRIASAVWRNVSVGGELKGRAPMKLTLPPGRHQVVLDGNPSASPERIVCRVELESAKETLIDLRASPPAVSRRGSCSRR